MPLWKQYLYYLDSLLHGDLGASFRYADWSVNDLVARALPVSLAIGGTAMVIAVVAGRRAGHRRGAAPEQRVDYVVMMVGNIGSVLPSFVLGPVLVLVFAIALPWLPSGGWDDFAPRYMVLPIALLTLINVSTIGRIMRGSLIEVLSSNFIRTARAKGLPMRAGRDAPRAAAGAAAGGVGDRAAGDLVDHVGHRHRVVVLDPGLGKLIVNGASDRDYTLVLGLVVLVTVLAVLLNLVVDLAYAWLDPKIRY